MIGHGGTAQPIAAVVLRSTNVAPWSNVKFDASWPATLESTSRLVVPGAVISGYETVAATVTPWPVALFTAVVDGKDRETVQAAPVQPGGLAGVGSG